MTPAKLAVAAATALTLLACNPALATGVVTTNQAPSPLADASFMTDLKVWADPTAGNLNASMSVLAYGVVTDPTTSSELNQDNRLGIPHYQAVTALRPNVSLHWDGLDLMARPRYDSNWQAWEEGKRSGGTDMSNSFYVNEWMARLRLMPSLFASYGRENLQWGPSYLLSPSNPFSGDNGKDNPMNEVPGADFAKLVWVPDFTWAVSLIVNTDDGLRGVPWSADKAYAAGVAGANQSLAAGQQEIDSGVADAMNFANSQRDAALASINSEYDAAVAEIESRTAHLPRVGDPISRILLREAATRRDAAIQQVQAGYNAGLRQIAAGQSAAEAQAQAQYSKAVQEFNANTLDLREFRKTYAMKVDCVLNRKYASLILSQRDTENLRLGYYGKWDASDAAVLYTEGSVAEGFEADWLGGISYTLNMGITLYAEYYYNGSGNADLPILDIIPPYRAVEPQEVLLRQHYVLLQATKTDILDRLDLTLRCVLNLDDSSDRLIAQTRFGLNDYADLFLVAAADTGDGNSEFGSVINYTVMGGIKISL